MKTLELLWIDKNSCIEEIIVHFTPLLKQEFNLSREKQQGYDSLICLEA